MYTTLQDLTVFLLLSEEFHYVIFILQYW